MANPHSPGPEGPDALDPSSNPASNAGGEPTPQGAAPPTSPTEPDDLFAEPPARDEVGRLAVTLNAMLARLRAARAAQRQLVADASHELRSPLTTVVAGLELTRGRGKPLRPGLV